MEELWERSIPIINITIEDIKIIFNKLINNIEIIEYNLVTIGCRNSNYIVNTNKGDFFIRFTPKDSQGYKNELRSYIILKDKINIPAPIKVGSYNNRTYIIYECIKGISLYNVEINKKIIEKVAEDLAKVHNIQEEEYSKFDLFRYPPFESWFDLFLNNEYAYERLGSKLVDRIKYLLMDKEEEIKTIDLYKSYIHSDFRPINMMINNNGEIYYVDWEFSNYGHILGDIGQFFRYDELFSKDKILLFEAKYNEVSKVKLPYNWFELAKLRDLINPLQLLGDKEDSPNKYRDLKHLVNKTMAFFNY